jgi:uncharacterized membrane protein YdjX (TVP38/TMEM64 family)
MDMADWLSNLNEERLMAFLEAFRALGPLPGIALTFMKSFVPPLPTLVIIGVNAAVYGLWLGFLYSWIGLVGGCIVTFLVVRRITGHPFLARWIQKPKMQKALVWARHNAFSYVFVLSLLPVGPFVVVNIAAAVARMRFRSFLVAIGAGKAVMVFAVSYLGHDWRRYAEQPIQLVYVLAFMGLALYIGKYIESRIVRAAKESFDGNISPPQ